MALVLDSIGGTHTIEPDGKRYRLDADVRVRELHGSCPRGLTATGNAVIAASDGDTLTLKDVATPTQLTPLSGDFTFHG
jgi:hypothetical protein